MLQNWTYGGYAGQYPHVETLSAGKVRWNEIDQGKDFSCHFSVAYVSRSGGMSNELNNIISRNSDGVYEGIAIGGDRSVKISSDKTILSSSISVIQVQPSPIISFDMKKIPKRRSLFFLAKSVSD